MNKEQYFCKIACMKKMMIESPVDSFKIKNDNWFCRFASIICPNIGSPTVSFKLYLDNAFYKMNESEFHKSFFDAMYHHYNNNILLTPLKAGVVGHHDKTTSEKIAACLTGTKEELENWKHFVFNNKLPLFINIVMTIDQHNNSLDYVPWLVDKQYTDEEIAKLFNFTQEEVDFIELTLAKYERHADFYTRLATGRPNK